MSTDESRVKVYGTDWCGVTTRTRRHLDSLGVPYQYIDIERDPAAAQWVRDQNRGLEMKPTLDIEGEVLSVPQDRVLDGVLEDHGILR
ncbi:MAG: glutaredoxin family protein [Chloroflexota bacterium]|nr:glutaredoxin family protein [Chloroflexota bacterium]